jgi:hypothetical protein
MGNVFGCDRLVKLFRVQRYIMLKAFYWRAAAIAVLLASTLVFGVDNREEPSNRRGSLEMLDKYNVVWDSPSKDSSGSMPIGNGEIGLNVWWEKDGDLQFFIARTDAWDEAGRLVKVGKVRVHLEPNPVDGVRAFRQTLNLADGTIYFVLGEPPEQIKVSLSVDAYHPVIYITADGQKPVEVLTSIELWRTQRKKIDYSGQGYFGDPGYQHPQLAFVGPDTIIARENWPASAADNRIGWYHHNGKSDWYELSARHQGLEGYQGQDPLENRTFGAVITAEGGRCLDERTLRSPAALNNRFSIYVVTKQPALPNEWLNAVEETVRSVEKIPWDQSRRSHVQWWNDFWQRSWIFVSSAADSPGQPIFEKNNHPIRFGIDQNGQNVFRGEIARASVLKQALAEAEIEKLMKEPREQTLPSNFKPYAAFTKPEQVLEGSENFHPSEGLTLEAWVKPEKQADGGGRIIDKTTPGTVNGFLLDTWPGNSLRLITSACTLVVRDCLPEGRWVHVAAVADPAAGGTFKLFLDGRKIAEEKGQAEDPAVAVTRGYILQRWITACAGRGELPIKFNGSLFTVPYANGWKGDPDYRQWGSGYWWQNTRLPYIYACTAGDFDLLQTLFRTYTGEHLEIAKYRNQHHLKTEGAFLNECAYFWGHAFNDCYGFNRPADLPAGINELGYHRWEFTSGYELVYMMLDYYEHTLDESFLKKTLLPFAYQILTFYDAWYKTDVDGKIVIHPAQALETWWDCTNPQPDIAGLTVVTERLFLLPENLTTTEQRGLWRRLRDKMPELPRREFNGKHLLAAAEKFDRKMNIENPEMYAVFPFRLIAVGRPDIEMGIETLRHLTDKGNIGWRQDDIFMAYLGLADEAREYLVGRARNKDKNSRFLAFWGPNYDWIPDQDHGGILMKTLQSMLLQADGQKIYLLPAWPKGWDVDFKLHAPSKTTVEGLYRDGKIQRLKISPESRRKDIKLMQPQ